MNLVESLEHRAAERGGQPAIIETRGGRDTETSFAGLASGSARAAALLASRGVERGSHVLMLAPMSAGLYELLIAVFRLGAVAMFLDPSAGRDHVSRCLRILEPRAFVGSPRAHLLRLFVRELRRVPAKFALGGWAPGAVSCGRGAAAEPLAALARCEAEHPALVTFTSGSTGEPKAVVRTHGFLLAQHRALEKALCLRPGERDLTTLPIFLLANLASGVTSIIPDADLRRPGAIDPRPVLDQIHRLRPSSCGASPAFLERLCEACEEDGRNLAPIRRFFVGGGPVFPNLIERGKRLLPEGELIAVYGSTEAEPIAHVAAGEIAPGDFEHMRGGAGLLAGKPVEDIELAVLRNRWGATIGPFDERAFRDARCAAGATGEIAVSGAHVVRGYLGGRGDSETKFDVGGARWHRTGDLGRLDESGRLWLLGRCSAAIRDARGALYPFAVECAAQQLQGVRRAALAFVGGRRVLAFERSGAHPSEEEARAALRWVQLDAVMRFDRLPLDRRHNTKIDYPKLVAEVERRLRAQSSDQSV